MVDTRILCRKHLLGEHVETHMFVGAINRGKPVQGYLDRNLLEADSLRARHDALAREMEARGYAHRSPLPELQRTPQESRIDREASLKDLLARCQGCRERNAK